MSNTLRSSSTRKMSTLEYLTFFLKANPSSMIKVASCGCNFTSVFGALCSCNFVKKCLSVASLSLPDIYLVQWYHDSRGAGLCVMYCPLSKREKISADCFINGRDNDLMHF
ncbi:hypothetical protein KP509_13G035500 [Ceratopteris richardii]|uniref:Uncharacterized protein n=1 Tax=Ceratopteris richardii TaxID=49495 RepID=A0A8T2TK47_CERRI|nr:hypothetical protein KP509_13G035500 [Ceratopteris richardii]